MKKLLLLAIIAAALWYGVFQQGYGVDRVVGMVKAVPQQVTSLLRSAGSDEQSVAELPVQQKCTTAAGEVIYGDIPEGTVCEKVEKVQGALTVVPSRVITGERGIAVGGKSTVSKASKPVSQVASGCDGRTHCSHMTSCAEARYFINHCPGTKMDGDGDGVPCETQWCEGE